MATSNPQETPGREHRRPRARGASAPCRPPASGWAATEGPGRRRLTTESRPGVPPTVTSLEIAARGADVAVLPIGSFEQHGAHLPLATDTLFASAIAERIATDCGLFLLPPITIGCSHEHAGWIGSVSVSARTLHHIVCDVADSLAKSGRQKLVLVNAHGGNYVLSNVVQEANVNGRRMALFPTGDDLREARTAAGVESTNHEDMHAGEAETSILLATTPDVVRASYTKPTISSTTAGTTHARHGRLHRHRCHRPPVARNR